MNGDRGGLGGCCSGAADEKAGATSEAAFSIVSPAAPSLVAAACDECPSEGRRAYTFRVSLNCPTLSRPETLLSAVSSEVVLCDRRRVPLSLDECPGFGMLI